MTASRRKRTETILLAMFSIASVLPMRLFAESRFGFLAEIGSMIFLFAIAEIARKIAVGHQSSSDLAASAVAFSSTRIAVFLLAITPVISAVLARWFGRPIAFEITILTTFGSTSLAIALLATSDRTGASSLVISGFLVLFSTSISDDNRAIWFATAWMGVCVWHFVANHWEKFDLKAADSVRLAIGMRPASVILALVILVFGGWIVGDRFGDPYRFVNGMMPTSGGSKWSDPAARSGIGSGDKAIAAKDHAESFGAVESEIFLESTESTLFDMFNDMIGEPKLKNKWERRQGMTNGNVIEMHQTAARSEKGGSSFSTDRMPPKKHRHLGNATGPAVIQWSGPTGVRLAMRRFDTFDGTEWTNSATLADEKLIRTEIDDHVWFFDRNLRSAALSDDADVQVNLVKVLRLKSARLPSPMMTAGLHIKDIDRQDFFAIDDDGSFYMPGREKVPPMTVVNMASIDVMEDELIAGVPQYEGLQAIIEDLRSNYTLDRDAVAATDDPIAEFDRTRRGGDYLFATAAAQRASEIGLRSRIVTGFYVRPGSFDLAAGHANVLAEDVHVWTEIQLADGRWFEIEPTPGYRQPIYTPSIWLTVKRFVKTYWLHGVAIITLLMLCWRFRVVWIEWCFAAAWLFSWPLGRKFQLRLAMKIVETRGRLVGRCRPPGVPQRDWMESLVASDVHLRDRVRDFCDDADNIIFGGRDRRGGNGGIQRQHLSGVVKGLNARQLKKNYKRATS